MNISEQQLNNMMAAVSVALQPLVRVVPMTAVEWADQNYYLPKESSYGEGEWKTLPFQIAIMNCMGNDQVRTVTVSTASFCWWKDSRRHMPGPSPCMKILNPVR